MTYDEQIAYLTKYPKQIENHWLKGEGLFKLLSGWHSFRFNAGCLTTIRSNPTSNKVYIKEDIDEDLTLQINSDIRIPKSPEDITVEHLPVFKEWQEKIDELSK